MKRLLIRVLTRIVLNFCTTAIVARVLREDATLRTWLTELIGEAAIIDKDETLTWDDIARDVVEHIISSPAGRGEVR